MLRKVIGWGLILFVVYYVATEPSSAAGFVHSAAAGVHNAAASGAQFVRDLHG